MCFRWQAEVPVVQGGGGSREAEVRSQLPIREVLLNLGDGQLAPCLRR